MTKMASKCDRALSNSITQVSLSCLLKAILGEFKSLVIVPKTIHLRLLRQASLEEKKDIIIYFKNKFHQPFFITMGHFEFAFES